MEWQYKAHVRCLLGPLRSLEHSSYEVPAGDLIPHCEQPLEVLEIRITDTWLTAQHLNGCVELNLLCGWFTGYARFQKSGVPEAQTFRVSDYSGNHTHTLRSLAFGNSAILGFWNVEVWNSGNLEIG